MMLTWSNSIWQWRLMELDIQDDDLVRMCQVGYEKFGPFLL